MAADSSPGAAFFDLDRTLMEGSSAFQFGRAAYRAGLLSRRQLMSDGWANLKFRLRGASDEDSHELRDRISRSLQGTPVRDMERRGRGRRGGGSAARCLRPHGRGRRVYIFTAASQELAEMLARVLAFDGAIGSQFSEVIDGVYTGRPGALFAYGGDKARAIEQLAEREGLSLSESYAYSDSASDLPMLSVVGHPVAVNPDAALAKAAREKSWDVLRFDRLGRRLKAAVGLAGAAVAGGVGSAAVAAHNRRRRGLVAKLR